MARSDEFLKPDMRVALKTWFANGSPTPIEGLSLERSNAAYAALFETEGMVRIDGATSSATLIVHYELTTAALCCLELMRKADK